MNCPSNEKFTLGTVVKAIAGRDAGRLFVIVGAYGKDALIADGKTRKLEKPKRKNIRHLRVTNTVLQIQDLTDKSLRKKLNAAQEENTTNRL